MSEKWHYISRANGADELYNLELDPMEWKNLVNTKTPDTEAVVKKLRAYLPGKNADEIKSISIGDSDNENRKVPNTPDLTIKARRILSELK